LTLGVSVRHRSGEADQQLAQEVARLWGGHHEQGPPEVWVERPGQKAIIIGKRGEALKAAASQARLEMQKLFDCPVHLEVWVKLKKSWSSDEAALASLGYRDP
jgi:hypothetical protein